MRILRTMAKTAVAFLSAAALVGTAPGPANALTTFQIANIASDTPMCVTPYGGGTANGTLLVQWACNDNLSQDWSFTATSYGNLVVNKKSGRCITPYGGSTGNGAYLTLWDCDSNDTSQKWRTDSIGNLENLHSGKYIAASGGGSQSGTQLTLWSYVYSDYNLWLLI